MGKLPWPPMCLLSAICHHYTHHCTSVHCNVMTHNTFHNSVYVSSLHTALYPCTVICHHCTGYKIKVRTGDVSGGRAAKISTIHFKPKPDCQSEMVRLNITNRLFLFVPRYKLTSSFFSLITKINFKSKPDCQSDLQTKNNNGQ